MLYAAQKASGKTDKLLFLFSSRSFDQLLMRLKYMEQYAEARKDQARAIERAQSLLQAQVAATQVKKDEQSALLSEEEKENTSLTQLKQQQRGLVRKLEKEEKQLKRDLEETRKAIVKLDKLIADIIREEMERAAREAAIAKEKTNTNKTAPELDIKLSASFEENRNKLAWPASGIVSQKFGRQKHPVLKNVTLDNLGVNIQTREGERVRVVFDGTVKTISANPLLGTTVIVNHGDYFTVYTGLREVFVKSGQKVTTNQELGSVQQNVEGVPELRFRIYKQTTPLDPEVWLRN